VNKPEPMKAQKTVANVTKPSPTHGETAEQPRPELTEVELRDVSGGCCTGKHYS